MPPVMPIVPWRLPLIPVPYAGAHALESTHHTHGGSETAHGELGKEGRGSGAQSYNYDVCEGTHGGLFLCYWTTICECWLRYFV